MKSLLSVFVVLMIAGLSFSLQAQPVVNRAETQTTIDSSQQIADLIVNSKIPVLVDFWAAWCAPCRMLNPIIKDLEKEYKEKVLFVKVNVDVHRSISSYFGVSGIPAVFIVNNKTVVKALPGLQSKEAYAAALDEVLSAPAEPSVPSPAKPAK